MKKTKKTLQVELTFLFLLLKAALEVFAYVLSTMGKVCIIG